MNFVTADNIDNVLDIALDFSSAKLSALTEDSKLALISEGERADTGVFIRQ